MLHKGVFYIYPKILITGSKQFSLLANRLLQTINIPDWIELDVSEYPIEALIEHISISMTELRHKYEPATIILSGEQSAKSLEKRLINNIVIPVKVSEMDILLQAPSNNTKTETAIINYNTNLEKIDQLISRLGLSINQYSFRNQKEIHTLFNKLKKRGVHKIIGGSYACAIASDYGIESSFFYSEQSLKEAIDTAIKYLTIYRKEMEQSALFRTVVQKNNSGILSTDQQNTITTASQSAEKLLGLNKDKIISWNLNQFFHNKITLSEDHEYPTVINWGNKKLAVTHSMVRLSHFKVGSIVIIDGVDDLQEKELNIRKKINEKPLQSQYKFDDIIGKSEKINQAKKHAMKFSRTNSSILIQGESGTGKELFAQSIHDTSNRSDRTFVAINCAALPENLLDSELFGYEEGAFTGASKGGKKGLFELADKGTIFLDEISELPIHLQSKLLRVLQEKEVMRIGSHKIIPVDVRVIAATNKNLLQSIQSQKFREDLYYRISVLQLSIPPLRERPEDIEEFTLHYISQFHDFQSSLMTKSTLTQLYNYSFPGNIRELINILERFHVYCMDEDPSEDNLAQFMHQAIYPTEKTDCVPMKETLNLKTMEQQLIHTALTKNKGNKNLAAKDLGISRSTLWRKLEIDH
ncbi:sigma 54-interacting transcriptional regulator [Salicibibacter kimchii]|uniref:AAA family ATPase n=1 Tax=Salicibibacter kimchii TaxID=2099786 RepID=A0A345BWE2_9BACI|nr:sigma 54-interacting transcriptional regulator [Salicibibacter kimchii]AXF55273.1 AAA family ATPase [Salicibibacter kimchii]